MNTLYCNCNFVFIMRGENDIPYCSECGKIVKEELSTEALWRNCFGEIEANEIEQSKLNEDKHWENIIKNL